MGPEFDGPGLYEDVLVDLKAEFRREREEGEKLSYLQISSEFVGVC